MRSPRMGGKSLPRCVSSETSFLRISLRASAIVSTITSFISNRSTCAGAFLTKARMRWYDIAAPRAVLDDGPERIGDLVQIGRLGPQHTRRSIGIGDKR